VQPGNQSHQGAEFGSAVGPCPAVAAQPHQIVEREVGDSEGEGWVHTGTNIEHWLPSAKLIAGPAVLPTSAGPCGATQPRPWRLRLLIRPETAHDRCHRTLTSLRRLTGEETRDAHLQRDRLGLSG
jgi:hypothetical protein